MYAFVDYGSHESYSFAFIKIDESDKDKFIKYCKNSQRIPSDDIERIELRAWVKDLNNVNLESYEIMTVQKHQERYGKQLARIEEMKDRHYLRNKIQEIEKMLEYTFK